MLFIGYRILIVLLVSPKIMTSERGKYDMSIAKGEEQDFVSLFSTLKS